MKKIVIISAIYFFFLAIIVAFTFLRGNVTSEYTEYDRYTRDNLLAVVTGIEYYYSINNVLPSSLTQIVDENQFYSNSIIYNAPSENRFEYTPTGEKDFKLCVEFLTNYNSTGESWNRSYYNRTIKLDEVEHQKGLNCYKYNVTNLEVSEF